MKFLIYVVDDDRHYARLLSYQLEKGTENEVRVYNSGEDVLAVMDDRPDLILLDIMMPGIDGIQTLKEIKRRMPEAAVVMVSAQGTLDIAIEAMKSGAYDYITKGQDDFVKLNNIVRNVTEKISLAREVENLRGEVAQRYGLNEIVGDSPSMESVYRLLQKSLRGDLTVAIQGESGTGKELIARAIHYNSARRRGPFVVVNCAAIPHELMESEFFGHEKGSFTGAIARKTGKFEQAHGGTIFLDEISELDLGLQAKLLRALQSREITRVGGNDTFMFDARVISATNREILQMIREGKFREDLYYRLFQFPITLPPLRERGQDVLVLAQHFLKEYRKAKPDTIAKRLSSEATRSILEYNWPGNVRELKSVIERALLVADTEEIMTEDLMLHLSLSIKPWEERSGSREKPPTTETSVQPAKPEFDESVMETPSTIEVLLGTKQDDTIVSLDDLKRQAVERAYRLCEGNVDKAAVELGIGRATMYRLLKKFGILDI
ncbi:MAG: sigma-54-dependent Fis family transcriptional regulator [Bacteroidetes Order II. Incertae sedis bacterium]|nr:sigma-54-dependent Fis family transcriptional regulator [Bacteroidetes Order II. bacterium]